jgi:quinol monooxygenase YgiN
MIVLHAAFPLDPATREEALEHVETLVEKSQAEEGILEYHAATDVSDPNVVRIFEQYEDEAAFEAHTQTDHYRAFEEALPKHLAGEPEVRQFTVDSATDLDL